MLESLFNKVGEVCNIVKNRLQHRGFPVNIPIFFKKQFVTDLGSWARHTCIRYNLLSPLSTWRDYML